MAYIDQVRVKVGENDPTLYDVHSRANGDSGNITKISQIGEVTDSGISGSDVEQNIVDSSTYETIYSELEITSGISGTKLKNVLSELSDRAVNYKSRIEELETEYSTGVDEKITDKINELDVADSAVSHFFVTSVQESDGKVSVSRSQPSSSDISDFSEAVNNVIGGASNIVFFADV